MTTIGDTSSRLRMVFTQVLRISDDVPDENISMETQPAWDSMAHINLILAIEQEFRIALTPEEASEAITLDGFREIIGRKQKEGQGG